MNACYPSADLRGAQVRSIRHGAVLMLVAAALPFAIVLGITLAIFATVGTGFAPVQASTSAGDADPSQGRAILGKLTSTQVGNAQIIYHVGISMQLPQQAEIIAIATAMQESRLTDLPFGTYDSLGLFQQRPSQGWGSPSEIMQPVYAATMFYDALVQVPGWQSLPLTVAAQAVQRSAYPGAYTQWGPLATALVAMFDGTATNCLSDNSSGVPASGTTRLPSGFSLPPGTPAPIVAAITYALAELGKPYRWGGVGPAGFDCSGLVMMAYQAAGISLPRTTFQQVYSGTPVYSFSQLLPGDLIFTPGSDGTATDPGHVGMYIGSGLVVSAPETGEPVMITPLSGYWREQAVAIRRIV
jgi:cell wall-associated NlpC family hydrolase